MIGYLFKNSYTKIETGILKIHPPSFINHRGHRVAIASKNTEDNEGCPSPVAAFLTAKNGKASHSHSLSLFTPSP